MRARGPPLTHTHRSRVIRVRPAKAISTHCHRDHATPQPQPDSLAEKVEGNDGRNSATVVESPLTSGSSSTQWVDRLLDEPLDSLRMPQWDQDEESTDIESQKVVQMSESTQKAIKTAFGRPLHNAARLQTRKAYPFPMTEDTKCLVLCPAGNNLWKIRLGNIACFSWVFAHISRV